MGSNEPMPNKMERFTQRARRVLSLAQDEAERFQHDTIDTEHLLMGLMREEGGVAGRVLRDLGLEERRVEELIERLTLATTRTGIVPLDLSPGTKKVLELAVDEARKMNHRYVDTGHLLLGLVRMPDGVALDVLKRMGISSEEIRRRIRRLWEESPVQPPPPETHRATAESANTEPVDESQIHPPDERMAGLEAQHRRSSLRSRLQAQHSAERMKILDMINDGKITVDEGERLLMALHQPVVPLPIMTRDYLSLRVVLATTLRQPQMEKRHLHVIVTDKAKGTVLMDVRLPFSQVERILGSLMEGLFKDASGKVLDVEDDEFRTIQAFVEDDPPEK